MSNVKTTPFNIEMPADLAVAVSKAAAVAGMTAEAMINECIGQQFETALRHRVLIQRQNDVDEALLELARLVGRLSAGANQPPTDLCRYRPADTK
ncbi:hypothetical protein V1281_004105 [Nitrobacteraceae bacterium AZCC 2161]